jgi:porin
MSANFMLNRQLNTLLHCIVLFGLVAPQASLAFNSKDITWDAYAVAEDISNLYGGIKTGSTYTLAGHLAASVQTDALHLWRNGQFTLGALGIQQNNYPFFYNGSIQGPSGYTGVPEIKLSDLYYQQKFKGFRLRAGIMDIDEHFNQVKLAVDNLMNSAFTNTIALSYNVQLATYPYPGLGCELAYSFDNLQIQTAIYQGNPKHQSTAFSKGFFLIGELKYDLQIFSSSAENYIFTLGLWEYQPHDAWLLTSQHGLYSSFEVAWNSRRGPKFGATIQAGMAQDKDLAVPYSVAASLTVSNLYDVRPKDSLNFGYGQVWLQGLQHNETFYEANYLFDLSKNWKLVLPDVQYFVTPGGSFKNSWVLLVRLIYEHGETEIEF